MLTDKIESVCCEIYECQDALNQMVNPDWMNAGYNWVRAAWVEAAELQDHLGYKHWKKQTPNMEQAGLEVVDLLHFAVSDMLQNRVSVDSFIEMTALAMRAPLRPVEADEKEEKQRKLVAVDSFVESVLTYDEVTAADVYRVARMLQIDIPWLLRWYIGKNALNRFRQLNGYKEGTYIKIWNGYEDNEHLADILNSTDDVLTIDEVMSALSQIYRTL